MSNEKGTRINATYEKVIRDIFAAKGFTVESVLRYNSTIACDISDDTTGVPLHAAWKYVSNEESVACVVKLAEDAAKMIASRACSNEA